MTNPRRFSSSEDQALGVLARAPFVHVAAPAPEGAPIVRALHAVLSGRTLYFHGAQAGEKAELLPGTRVTVTAERVIARIPSWFVDPNIACPATTYYESAVATGTAEAVDEPDDKAHVLQHLMMRFQPEGGHLEVTTRHPTYNAALKTLLVARIRLDSIHGKYKVGQNRSKKQIERIAEQLWGRGAPGDLEAIAPILAAHPDEPRPSFLEGPEGTYLCPALGEVDLPEVLDLLRGQYWTLEETDDALAASHRAATVWVGMRVRETGRLVASARAISDGARHAHIADVVVAPDYRGRGLGKALLRFLLDHPRLRGVRMPRLVTRDAAALYEAFGFREERPRYTLMVRTQTSARSVTDASQAPDTT